MKTIHLKNYLYCDDNTLAVKLALADCQPGTTLSLDGLKLDFYNYYAQTSFEMYPLYDQTAKRYVFYLDKMQNITVDGEGAELIFHGDIAPFGVYRSENITLKNFSIDYFHPFFFQAKIVSVGADYYEIETQSDEFKARLTSQGELNFYSEHDDFSHLTSAPLVTEFDAEHARPSFMPAYFPNIKPEKPIADFLKSLERKMRCEQVGPNRLRFYYLEPPKHRHTEGNYWVCLHGSRKNCAIYLQESDQVILNNIQMYGSAAMGVVGLRTNNITASYVNSTVRNGRMVAVKDDMFHLVNCGGKVELANCTMENMMDDAVNIHGNYLTVDKILNANTVVATLNNPQKAVYSCAARAQDVLTATNPETLLPEFDLTVLKTKRISMNGMLLTLKEPVTDRLKAGTLLENRAQMPEVYIHHCKTGNNRPRGFLIATPKKTVIEHCKFYNSCEAIKLTALAEPYFESGRVANLTVQNCLFYNAAYLGAPVISSAPRVNGNSTQGVHQNITIQNNTFYSNGSGLIKLFKTDRVFIKNNTYIKTNFGVARKPFNNGVFAENCNEVIAEKLKVEKA